jgi:hypothetical protein
VGRLWTIEIEVAVTGAVIELRAMVPVGSPRKSAAIIPSVNDETLTSGLPIASAEKCLMISDRWVNAIFNT